MVERVISLTSLILFVSIFRYKKFWNVLGGKNNFEIVVVLLSYPSCIGVFKRPYSYCFFFFDEHSYVLSGWALFYEGKCKWVKSLNFKIVIHRSMLLPDSYKVRYTQLSKSINWPTEKGCGCKLNYLGVFGEYFQTTIFSF